MAIATTNPATGVVEQVFEPLTADEIEAALALAERAFAAHRVTSFEQRATWMRASADVLERDVERIATVMTTEMGKTLASAKAEVRKCAMACRFYAEHAEAFLADEPAAAERVGAADAVRALRAARPGARGDAVELPAVAGDALRRAGADGRQRRAAQARVERAPERADHRGAVPRGPASRAGVFQTLLIGSGQVEGILRDPRVAAATLTGSEPAGRAVAAIAGDEIKTTVLELGGSDPFVVMPSADIERAAAIAVVARVPEQRPELHRGQALHRARATSTTSSSGLRRRHGRAARRRPDARHHRHRPARHRAGRARRRGAGGRRGRPGRRRRLRRRRASTAPAGSTRPPWSPASRRRCGCTPRRCSARSPP